MSAPTSSTSDSANGSKAFLRDFLQRRVHSISGLFLLLFLFEHLLTNSQAALWIGDDGSGFVRMVNIIHSLPYLPVIEWLLLATPIAIHAYLGVRYLKEAHYNSLIGSQKGDKPYFTYNRSKAYTLQRITAWFLLVAIVGHVVHLRVMHNPVETHLASEKRYLVSLTIDEGLDTVIDRLGARVVGVQDEWLHEPKPDFQDQEIQRQNELRRYQEAIDSLQRFDRVVVASPNFGTAMLLVVRDVFKNPWICVIYTFFVLSTVYHAGNGFWTALITWGITPSARSQDVMRKASQVMMGVLTFLGLSAIWLSYWVNLLD